MAAVSPVTDWREEHRFVEAATPSPCTASWMPKAAKRAWLRAILHNGVVTACSDPCSSSVVIFAWARSDHLVRSYNWILREGQVHFQMCQNTDYGTSQLQTKEDPSLRRELGFE